MKLTGVAAFVVVYLIAVAGVPAAAADRQQGEVIETFNCESKDNRHNECRYRSGGIVTVHVKRQLSRVRCVFDESWGTFDGGVWVDNGCRAEFEVRRPPQTGRYRPMGGSLKTVTCESQDRKLRECPVPGIDAASVQIERKLSSAPCTQGVSWGVMTGDNRFEGIWVNQGCRATFAYATREGSFRPWSDTPHSYDMSCESRKGRWNHCPVEQVNMARVEMITGNNACNAYKSWGVDDTGIWVRDNCQGTFRILYRH